MILKSKFLRYYYWLTIEFIKKHMRMILLSFFLSFFLITSLVSFSPYLNRFFFTRKEVVGIVGSFDINHVPEEIIEKISHGLVYVNEKGEIIPALTSSWEMINGGLEFNFHIKNNLFWDDGKEFTTKDLVYNFKDVDVKIIDKNTIYFTLHKKLPIFPTYLTKPVVRYPLHGVVGLYKVDNIKVSQGTIKEINLSPNKNDLPLIVYKFYGNESKLINAYKTGEINKMTLYRKGLVESFSEWKNTKISRSTDYSRVMTLFFKFQNKLLDQKDVRQAIDLTMPRKKLVEFGELANSPIPPTSWAYNPDLKQTVEDSDTAQKNLKKYTEEASTSAKLDFETFYDYLNTANIVDKRLKDVGLSTTVSLSNLDQPEKFDLLLAYWQIPKDPDQYFFWHSLQTQSNLLGYKNVRVDKLLEDGRGTLRVSARKSFYLQFQKIIADDLPAIFLYYPYTYTIQRK